MPQVPYTPYPQVDPSLESGLRNQSGAAATPEAFGAGLGHAIEGLGDIFAKHAIHMQDEANAARAKDLFLKADEEMAKVDLAYRQKEGVEAVNAHPQFAKDVMGIREKYRAVAGNGQVAKMFDNDFARRASFTIIDGARYAATQNKAYNRAASTAVKNNAEQFAGVHPEQEQVDEAIKTANDAIASEGAGRDPPEKIEFEQKLSTSRILGAAIDNLATYDPEGARKMLNENQTRIVNERRNQLNAKIESAESNLGAKQKSQDFVEGRVEGVPPMELTPKWLATAQQKAREYAKESHPTNPNYENVLVGQITARWHQDDQVQNKLNAEQKNHVLAAAGQAKSFDQIILDPDMSKAYYDQVERDPGFTKRIQQMIINNNKPDNTPTEARSALATRLTGMSRNAEGKKQFADYDLESADLTSADRNRLRLAQMKVKETGPVEAQLNKVLSYPEVKSQLNAAGVVRGKPESDEAKRYDTFISYLSDKVQEFVQDKKRLPFAKETTEMIAPILRKEALGSSFNPLNWFSNPQSPLTKEMPSAFRESNAKRFREQYGEEPPDGFLELQWLKYQLNQKRK